ncbi:MAG: hypothetical protein JXB26_13175 [Candidatus Aminicenantes bacterium]|nr:hypothetical protein [Candidatus Aminicenantes bacterium]
MSKILGVDVGSLTIKAAVYDPGKNKAEEIGIFPHKRRPLQKTLSLLEQWLSDKHICAAAFTGSMGNDLAEVLNAYYVNPHLASAEANIKIFPHLRTILNIGASSSNLIFIKEDKNGNPQLEDIVLPPHCSAGTGSFLDQSASRFGCSVKEFGQMALASKCPENISGTCAVFAGSDMIDKQQKGARKEDIAAGLHYAFVKYLLGCLGKGKALRFPFSFQGGVAANEGMVHILEDVLRSSGNGGEVFIPLHFRSMGAIGAAILAAERKTSSDFNVPFSSLQKRVQHAKKNAGHWGKFQDKSLPPLQFNDHIIIRKGRLDRIPAEKGKVPVYLGVDVGSVSTCLAVLYYPEKSGDHEWKMVAKKYLPTLSSPLEAVTRGLREIHREIGEKITVLDVAVTGSGRKFISDYLGGVSDVNEITAHRRGAQTVADRVGISFDEIFEIGGQDSKYIKGIEHFDMNKSCAAGTGSFIEEQAKQLGVGIEKFASYALKAPSPVSLGNKKCTVFIEEELAARQGYKSREDLLASAAYAVAENYLSQFKIGDKKGKTIFFQGGVALNRAVAAALQYFTQARIIVPEHNEMMGAVGAAIHARRQAKGRTRFVGMEHIEKRKYTMKSFQCEGCANFCNVSIVTTNDGMTVYGGDRCEKYSLSTSRKQTVPTDMPDLIKEREDLLTADYVPAWKPSGSSPLRIGIPRLFTQYYDYFPLWKTFFEQLGFEVVTSGKTNKKMIERGRNNVVTETCFPAEISYGHLKDLLDKKADFIFFPSLIDAPQTSWKERKTHYCTLSQNVPFSAPSTSYELLKVENRMLRPAVHLHPKRNNLEQEMVKTARRLGKSRQETEAALQAGWKAWTEFRRRIKKRREEICSSLEMYPHPVVIVGRPYTLGDPGIHMDLPRMIKKAGGFPIPVDFLPLEDVDIRDIQDLANWTFYHQVMRAAELIRSHPRLNSIFFSVFSCGPDSFLEEFFREALGGKPFLGIEVGKTTAPAHIQTRVEALMDSIKEKNNIPPFEKKSFLVHFPSKARILYAPYMDHDVPVFREAMKILGVDVEPLPLSSLQSLSLANRYMPEKTCLPARMTAGDYLDFLKSNHKDPQKIAFFNHQADGACRQKVYYLLQQLVFEQLGYNTIPIITPVPGKTAGYIAQLEWIRGGKKLTKRQAAKFFIRFWKSLTANEGIRQTVLSRRPYEREKGSMDDAYLKGLEEFCKTIVNGDIMKGACTFLERVLSVPIDPNRGKVNIGIVGEGYVRLHEFSNHKAIRRLEELGAVTVLPMASSFLNYAMESVFMSHRSWVYRMLSFLKTRIEHKVAKPVHPYLLFPEPAAGDVIREAAFYLDPRVVSEAVEGIGMASLYAKSEEIHGILNLIPAHCMAGSSLQCYLEKVHRNSDIPVLTISLDGIYDKGFQTNIEVLVHKAGLYKRSLE